MPFDFKLEGIELVDATKRQQAGACRWGAVLPARLAAGAGSNKVPRVAAGGNGNAAAAGKL